MVTWPLVTKCLLNMIEHVLKYWFLFSLYLTICLNRNVTAVMEFIVLFTSLVVVVVVVIIFLFCESYSFTDQWAWLQVLYHRETGRSRGFAFVTMSSIEDCETVIENLDGSVRTPLWVCEYFNILVSHFTSSFNFFSFFSNTWAAS
jgi:RNA recognition motif-containing protein